MASISTVTSSLVPPIPSKMARDFAWLTQAQAIHTFIIQSEQPKFAPLNCTGYDDAPCCGNPLKALKFTTTFHSCWGSGSNNLFAQCFDKELKPIKIPAATETLQKVFKKTIPEFLSIAAILWTETQDK